MGDKRAEALYKKKLEADKEAAAADFESGSSDTYNEDPEAVDAANSALKSGSRFNSIAEDNSEADYRAFLKMSDAQKMAFVNKRKKR